MAHTPFIKRSLLALSIAALSAPALVMASVSTGLLDQPAYNQERQDHYDGVSGQDPASERERSSVLDSPAGHTGGATSTTTMEPAGEGMGAAGDTGTTGRGAGSGTTVIEDGPSGAGTTGTGMGTGMDRDTMDRGTMNRDTMNRDTRGTGTMGTDDGMGTTTGTGTYGTGTGTGTGPGAMDRDSSFETDRNAPTTTNDPLRDSRDNRNTTPDRDTGTLR